MTHFGIVTDRLSCVRHHIALGVNSADTPVSLGLCICDHLVHADSESNSGRLVPIDEIVLSMELTHSEAEVLECLRSLVRRGTLEYMEIDLYRPLERLAVMDFGPTNTERN